MTQRRILKFLQERILPRNDPRDLGKAMAGDKAGLWRYRVGDYRLSCHIDDGAELILVLRVAHRKEAYR
jgi:mRNA interferase RelE/StbE